MEYLGHDAGPVMEWRMGVRCVYCPVDPGKPDVEKNRGSLPGWRPNLLVETFRRSHSLQSKTGKEQEISKNPEIVRLRVSRWTYWKVLN